MKTKTLHRIFVLTAFSLLTFMASAQVGNINGVVNYHNNPSLVLPGVTVSLKDAGNNVVQTTTTGIDGTYLFTNVPYGQYTLAGAYNLPAGGVSMADALLIQHYLLNQIPLSTIQLLAADVDDDGSVTQLDINTVVVYNLLHGNPFPSNWVFDEPTVLLNGNTGGTSMGGSTKGDVNGTFEPVNKFSTINFFASRFFYDATAGDEIELPVVFNETAELSGMMLEISYPAHLVEILDIKAPFDLFDFSVASSLIKITAMDLNNTGISFRKGQAVAFLKVRLKEGFLPGDEVRFKLNSNSHFVDRNAVHFSPKVSAPVVVSKAPRAELQSNYPNPFTAQTLITYKLGEASHANVTVYDLQGKQVAVLVNQYQPEGTYQVEFRPAHLKPGTYVCRLSVLGTVPTTSTRVMIITSD